MASTPSHVYTELMEVAEADSRLMVICIDHLTSSAVNIIDEEMGLALAKAVMEAEWYIENELINAVVLCSGKHQSFLAGADILFEQRITSKARAFSAMHAFGGVICKLESLDVPTFAVVNGAALGGGLELIIGCDYRIADEQYCTQLGLPEVKLGVLPGVGGCMRLPHMLGLSLALEFLLTGKQVEAKKALKCGLVDHLFTCTQSVKIENVTSSSYQYQWLPELTKCLMARKIGRHKFILKKIRKDDPVEMKVPDFSQLTEESVGKYVDWAKCNAKYFKKFPTPLFRNSWLEQLVKYRFAQRSIFKQVGRKMPSPYQCLHTTMACLNATTCREAVDVNAQGFAELVVTAESKCLMGLFLESRHAKRTALSYGGFCEKFSKEKSLIIILFNSICRSESKQAACFAQCAIHAGIKVVFAFDQHSQPSTEEVSMIANVIHDQFSYLVNKGRMTFQEVSDKLDQLLSFHSVEQIVEDVIDTAFVMDFTSTSKFACDAPKMIQQEFNCVDIRKTLQSHSAQSKVVCVSSQLGCLGDDNCSGNISVVNINTFYPMDRTCTTVEVFSSNPQETKEDIALVAALINAMGKVPIAGLEQGLSIMNLIVIRFWSRVAQFFCSKKNMSVSKIDKMIGFSPGPFQMMDQIGLPYVLGLAEQADLAGYNCNHLLQLLQPLVTVGDTGMGSGKGFYIWTNDQPVAANDIINDITDITDVTEQALGMKLSLLVAFEASKRAPNVDHSLLDLICVSGPMNFPPQEGGPFHYFYRNPKVFNEDELSIVRDPDASYSNTMLVREVEAMGPCLGMLPLPMMVPGYTPNNITLLLVSLVIVVFVLMFVFL